MRFLTKIRDRQFAKKMGGAYNLSRAVLAGVLAAGCLMPGLAEAAPEAPVLKTDPENTGSHKYVEFTTSGNTATITAVTGNAGGTIKIYWEPGARETSVEGYTINVKGVNSANPLTITPEIYIRGGYVDDGQCHI